MATVKKYNAVAQIEGRRITIEGGPFSDADIAAKVAKRYAEKHSCGWLVEPVHVTEHYSIEILRHIRSYQPFEIMFFEDPQEARAMLQKLGRDFTPANLVRPDGSTLAVNYPNPFAGTVGRRSKAEELYNARDPEWTKYSSIF